jgi:hypothetical protein
MARRWARRRAASPWLRAPGLPAARLLASERSYRRVRPVSCQQGVGNHVLPALHARWSELRHQGVAIAVHDQPRQAVGFAVHQPQAVALDVKSGSGRAPNLRKQLAKKGASMRCCFVKTPDPGADSGRRAERRPGQKLAFAGLHPHGLARCRRRPLAMAESKIQGWRRSRERSLPSLSRMVFMAPIVAGLAGATQDGAGRAQYGGREEIRNMRWWDKCRFWGWSCCCWPGLRAPQRRARCWNWTPRASPWPCHDWGD